ncbi:hypothetical protein Q4551_04720 [Oceanobacter sp. 5_MG-2023]|uniref:hypothetical protein n=1 Tax=Oceanobacter sp. 5_MG-2023 TaxID=3062645 RepID=UPI0026E1EB27|nr:hypothetical protein [Oceanobacter sp. 5_MG-2023]MDO6681579.1 hypothetical protein [Oceanobacter sp. 5_MG-2023]
MSPIVLVVISKRSNILLIKNGGLQYGTNPIIMATQTINDRQNSTAALLIIAVTLNEYRLTGFFKSMIDLAV